MAVPHAPKDVDRNREHRAAHRASRRSAGPLFTKTPRGRSNFGHPEEAVVFERKKRSPLLGGGSRTCLSLAVRVAVVESGGSRILADCTVVITRCATGLTKEAEVAVRVRKRTMHRPARA